MALTNVFSIIYQLVTRKLGRNLASQTGFIDYLTDRVQLIVKQYDCGQGDKVDQAMLIQMESVADLLTGQFGSSSSGSMNTSLDDWSDGSDEDLEDQDSIEMEVAKAWLF